MGRELNLGWPSTFIWYWPGTLNRATERRKTRWWNRTGTNRRPVESEDQTRIERERERDRDSERSSRFGYGPKQDRVWAEHENELTELVECEPFIWECEKRSKRSGRVIGADGDRTSSEKHRTRATRRRFQA
jgi:hypothetical protein